MSVIPVDLRSSIRKLLANAGRGLDKKTILLILGPPGLGKSTAVAEAIADGVADAPVIWWLVPLLELAEELTEHYQKLRGTFSAASLRNTGALSAEFCAAQGEKV